MKTAGPRMTRPLARPILAEPTRHEKNNNMHFTFEAQRNRQSPAAEQATFHVTRLWTHDAGRVAEISHLIDRTYRYHSIRELQWHLAERFVKPVQSLVLSRI